MIKKKDYSKPILTSHGDLKNITKDEGGSGTDFYTGGS